MNLFLDKLYYIENFGTGFPRTFVAYEGTGKSPQFIPSDNFFIVSLPNIKYVNDNRQINDLGLEILKLVKKSNA